METAPVRVRFAPSPTGHLHLGNVRTALFNWLFARQQNGTFVLRIEDTDAERSTQASVDSVLQDLKWLGLDWDEGPEAGGSFGPYRQTERYDLYARYAQKLLGEGKAYHCYCSHEDLEAGRQAAREAGRPFTYPGTCRFLGDQERLEREARGIRPSLRLKIQPKNVSFRDLVRGPVSIHTNAFGDWILVRPDGSPTYNFAVVVDDALMQITHVIRGEDHLSNTPKQILLYEAFGFPVPRFAHLSMILGPDGGKLSKRHGDVSVDAFREKGFLPQALDNGLALLGWSDPDGIEVFDLSSLRGRFGLDRVNKAAAIFDAAKFRHLNREHIKKLGDEELLSEARPCLEKAGRLPQGEMDPRVKDWALSLSQLLRERMEVFSDAVAATDPIFVFSPGSMDGEARAILKEPDAAKVISAFLKKARETDLAVPGAYRAAVLGIKEELKVKGKALFHPIRVALTCAASGPELEMLVPILASGARLSLPSPVLGPAERCEKVLAL